MKNGFFASAKASFYLSISMTTVLKVNAHDLNSQFFHDLGQMIPENSEIEIRIPEKKTQTGIVFR